MFPLIFWSRWTEHINKLEAVPEHSKYSSAPGCTNKKKHLVKGRRR